MTRKFLTAALLFSTALCCHTLSADTPATAPSAILTELTADYMAGKWDAVATTLHDHRSDFAALPQNQRADVETIFHAFTECHQPWWNIVKQNKKAPLHATIWNRTLDATFEPADNNAVNLTSTNGSLRFTLNWPTADMDSDAKVEHGFTKGELTELGIWMTLGQADAWSTIPADSMVNLSDDAKFALGRFLDFRSDLAGATYGSPRVRRWAIFLYLNTYLPKYVKMQTAMSRKSIGAMFLAEVLANPSKYPSIKLPASSDDMTEDKCAGLVKAYIEKHAWTFAEDNTLRDLLKKFALANGRDTYRTGLVTLPNNLQISLDPDKDAPLVAKRDAWIKAQLQRDSK